jgi:hypothetical protein
MFSIDHRRKRDSTLNKSIQCLFSLQADFRYNGSWIIQASITNGKPVVFVSIKYVVPSFHPPETTFSYLIILFANKFLIRSTHSSYRLASLGFLAGKALQDEGSLNLGVRDQRLALHWVQENIRKFGGDPKYVV